MFSFIVAALLLIATVAAARRSQAALMVAFIWSLSLVHLVKRVVFLEGDQSGLGYNVILAVPAVLLALCTAGVWRTVRPELSRRAGRGLVWYCAAGIVSSLAAFRAATPVNLVASLVTIIVPLGAFLLGASAPLGSSRFTVAARAFVISAVVTVLYGLPMWLTGPTPIERAWAEHRGRSSIQAYNVIARIEQRPNTDWRAFSYFADPFTWGFFLVVAIALWGALRARPSALSSGLTAFILGAGLFATLSRTPWLGLVGTAAGLYLIRTRSARSAKTWIVVSAVALLAMLWVGNFLYSTVFPSTTGAVSSANPLAQRVLTTGTVGERLGVWGELVDAVKEFPLVGIGQGTVNDFWGGGDVDVDWSRTRHNFLVVLVLTSGLPALLAFIWFIYGVFDAGVRTRPGQPFHDQRKWLIACVFGLLLTGYTNGPVFMSEGFFFICGVVVASDIRRSRRETQAEVVTA